jgi:hypothetical protein
VEAVIAGRETPDTSVGRQLWDLVQSVPKMDTVEFEKMLNSNLRDLLMVIYLSQLTKVRKFTFLFSNIGHPSTVQIVCVVRIWIPSPHPQTKKK